MRTRKVVRTAAAVAGVTVALAAIVVTAPGQPSMAAATHGPSRAELVAGCEQEVSRAVYGTRPVYPAPWHLLDHAHSPAFVVRACAAAVPVARVQLARFTSRIEAN